MNSKLVEILNQAASTHCSGDNKEKLSTINTNTNNMEILDTAFELNGSKIWKFGVS